MTIASPNDLVVALAGARQRLFSFASLANQSAGGWSHLWTSQVMPQAGTTPAAAAVLSKATQGALVNFTNATDPAKTYLLQLAAAAGGNGHTLYIVDRLAHMGGLGGNTTGDQSVLLDISGTGSNLAARRGSSDYSDVTWFVEIYADIGTTARTVTVTYTNAAGTPGQTTTFSLGGASPLNRAGRAFPLTFPGGCQYVDKVNMATGTGTAGSWGISACRVLTSVPLANSPAGELGDWASLGLPVVENDACLSAMLFAGAVTTGVIWGTLALGAA